LSLVPLAAVAGASGAPEKVGLVVLLTLAGLLASGSGGEALQRLLAASVVVVAPLLLLVDIRGSSALHGLGRHPLEAAVGGAGLAVVTVAWAVLYHHRQRLVAPLSLLALPFRIPISAGGTVANLLVPLYVVIAAATLGTLVFPAKREGEPPARGSAARLLGAALCLNLVLYGLQATYSPGFAKALQNGTFFLAPFTLLYAVLVRQRFPERLLAATLKAVAGLAAVLVAVGFVEYARGKVFLNPKLIAANSFDSFFRVNSVFFDPNIFGRFLAEVIVAVVVAIYASRSRRRALAAGALVVWLWGGLLTTYSESSMIALLVGLAVIVAYRKGPLRAALGLGLLLAFALAVVVLAPASARFGLSEPGGGANTATSGRVSLVGGGLRLLARRPLYGFGSGSFSTEYRRIERQASAATASHTTPVTVAAEQGLIGLLAYLALLGAAAWALAVGAGRSPPRLAVAACAAALFVHTLGYADFLEDPTTWFLLALGVALRAQADAARLDPRRRARPAPAQAAFPSGPLAG